MTKWVSLAADGKTVDVVCLYDPRPDIAAIEAPDEVFAGWTFDGTNWAAPDAQPSLTEAFEMARRLVDAHVDEVARSKGYNDAVACASYAGSTNAVWSAEASAFIAWRDAVWAGVFALRDKALAGTIAALPTGDELIASLPAIGWPA